MKWIASAGGPLILIPEKSYKLWSGIFKRSAYLIGIEEDAEDFLDPDETDYGRACLVDDYLGLVKVDSEEVLILGEEPMLTTFFFSLEQPVLARWCYGESEALVENYLATIDLDSIGNWEFALTLNISSTRQFLFDAACSASMLDHESNDYLPLNIPQGRYKIWTSMYEPDAKTKLIIHRFDATC